MKISTKIVAIKTAGMNTCLANACFKVTKIILTGRNMMSLFPGIFQHPENACILARMADPHEYNQWTE